MIYGIIYLYEWRVEINMIKIIPDPTFPNWDYTQVANTVFINGEVEDTCFSAEIVELNRIAAFLMSRLSKVTSDFATTNGKFFDFSEYGLLYKELHKLISFHKSPIFGKLTDVASTAVLNQFILRFWKYMHILKKFKGKCPEGVTWAAFSKSTIATCLSEPQNNHLIVPLYLSDTAYFENKCVKLSLFQNIVPRVFGVYISEIDKLDITKYVPSFVALYASKEKTNTTFMYSFPYTHPAYGDADLHRFVRTYCSPMGKHVKVRLSNPNFTTFLKDGPVSSHKP